MDAVRAAALCLIVLMAGACRAQADEDGDDQDEAREAVESGATVSLAQLLARSELQGLGDVVSVRLLREGHSWTYLLRFVDASGTVRDVRVDAGRAGDVRGHGGD